MSFPGSPIDLRTMQAAAEKASALLKVLGNPDRLLVMCRLSQDELSVGELEEQLGIRQPTLTLLCQAEAVDSARSARMSGYNSRTI